MGLMKCEATTNRHLPIKTHSYSVLRVPTTQLANMSIDLKFVKLTADGLEKELK